MFRDAPQNRIDEAIATLAALRERTRLIAAGGGCAFGLGLAVWSYATLRPLVSSLEAQHIEIAVLPNTLIESICVLLAAAVPMALAVATASWCATRIVRSSRRAWIVATAVRFSVDSGELEAATAGWE